VALSTETLPNGHRLTDESMATYFPEMLLGLDKSGNAKSKEMKNKDVKNNWMQQSNFKDNASGFIQIADFADDQKALHAFKTVMTSEDSNDGYNR
jgi:hypothetical protein